MFSSYLRELLVSVGFGSIFGLLLAHCGNAPKTILEKFGQGAFKNEVKCPVKFKNYEQILWSM